MIGGQSANWTEPSPRNSGDVSQPGSRIANSEENKPSSQTLIASILLSFSGLGLFCFLKGQSSSRD